MTHDAVTIEQVLSNWRFAVCFAEGVRTETGEYGTVVGKTPAGLFDVVLGKGDKAATGRGTFRLNQLFPAWWPEAQFRRTQEGKQS